MKKNAHTSHLTKIQRRNVPSYNFHHQIQQLYLTVILDQGTKYPGIKDRMIKIVSFLDIIVAQKSLSSKRPYINKGL